MRSRQILPCVALAGLAVALLAPPVADAVIVRTDRSLERTLELGERYPFVCSAGELASADTIGWHLVGG